jgi:2-keto-4-pentenoate hydratase/2-oxohepta-3-ene-1,7-dioic acid hydratase in catechol pathway
MKVATVSIAGERRVGQVTEDGRSIAPFDLPLAEAQDGVLALIRRDGRGLPPALSPISMTQVVIEAPIPAPRRNIFCVGKNYHDHAHEFAKSGFDSSAAKGAVPSSPIVFSKVPESRRQDCASPLRPLDADREIAGVRHSGVGFPAEFRSKDKMRGEEKCAAGTNRRNHHGL